MRVKNLEGAIKFYALDGLRGLLALWILVGHTTNILVEAYHLDGYLLSILELSWIGVDGFFILSGFIIMHQYEDRMQSWPEYFLFLRKRLARIYPLYFGIFILVYFTIGHNPWGHGPYIYDIIRYVTLTHTWWNFSHYIWFNPSWSLSAEWGVYVLFPLLLFFIRKLSTPISIIKGVVVWLSFYLLLHLVLVENNMRVFIQCALFRAVPCFVVGMLLYRYYRLQSNTTRFITADLALSYVFLIIAVLHITRNASELWAGFMLVPVLCWLIFLLAQEKGFFAEFLQTRIMQWLGQVSLSIYLIQFLFLEWLSPLIEQAPQLYPLLVVVFTLIASGVVYPFWEKPMRKWLNQ